jgi:hypothetical protein
VEKGAGSKVALTTLNTGRLTIPAACVGLMKRCLGYARDWAAERTQWGQPIGKHAAIADKIARIAANAFATEAMTMLTAALVDRDKADIRIEAAMCKMFGSEAAWRAVDETMQIRGGRGYETAQSLKNRGEEPVPIERMMRGRAHQSHLRRIVGDHAPVPRARGARSAPEGRGRALDSRCPSGSGPRRAEGSGFLRALVSGLLLPAAARLRISPRRFGPRSRTSAKTSRRLARTLFHAMAKHGPKLERQQLTLGRIVTRNRAVCDSPPPRCTPTRWLKRGMTSIRRRKSNSSCRASSLMRRAGFAGSFAALAHNNDARNYKFTQSILEGSTVTCGAGSSTSSWFSTLVSSLG